MNRIRFIGGCLALGGAALLTGCVAVPGGYGYGDPYYGDPGPVVVPGPPVYIEGGGGGYYGGRPYYDRPGYYGRPGYAPGYGPRPGYGPGNGPRPGYGPGGRPPPTAALPRPPRGEPPLPGSVFRSQRVDPGPNHSNNDQRP